MDTRKTEDAYIVDFLEQHLGHDDCLRYEVNSQTVDALQNLAQQNRLQDKITQNVIADYHLKTEEYQVESKRLASVLEKLGLSPVSLSQAGKANLQTIVDTSLALEVIDSSDGKLYAALSDFYQNSIDLIEERIKLEKQNRVLETKIMKVIRQGDKLQRSLEQLEEHAKKSEHELDQKSKDTVFLTCKTKEYQKKICVHQAQLDENLVESSIYHGTLVNKHKELEEMQEALKPMKAKLDSYNVLPPDYVLAKIKLEELKSEIKSLEGELSKHMDLMNI